jgi:type I restriction enzyme S subunit
MIANLKPYPAYKTSGVSWLGEVPDHWDSKPGFALFREKQVRNTGMAETQVLSLSYGRIVIKPPEKLHGLVPESFETYQIVDPGDIIIRATDLQNDWTSLRVGFVRNRGIITSAYLRLKTTSALTPEYGYQLLHGFDLMKIFYGFGSGLRQNLSFDDFKRMAIFVPPADEQAAIVRYLAYMDRRIQRYIRSKQTLIELLNEQKRAVIHNAVTQGLDTSVPLKSSGVDSLGPLPTHWEVVALRRRWRVTDCKHLTVPFVEEGIPLASVREAQNFDLSLTDANRTTVDWYATLIEGGRKPRRGDLVYCRNVGVGAATFVDTDEQFAMGQDVCLISSLNENQRYLNYFIHSPLMDRQLAALLVGSTFPRINVADVKGLLIFVPPRAEQDRIVVHLDGSLKRIDSAIGTAARGVTLLREFRSRLIADVVIGKLDVREVAASLPDEISQEEMILDEMEPFAEDGLEDDDSGLEAFLEEVEA